VVAGGDGALADGVGELAEEHPEVRDARETAAAV
jgi:hypothetical protein